MNTKKFSFLTILFHHNNLGLGWYQRCNPYADFCWSCAPREIRVRTLIQEIKWKEKSKETIKTIKVFSRQIQTTQKQNFIILMGLKPRESTFFQRI